MIELLEQFQCFDKDIQAVSIVSAGVVALGALWALTEILSVLFRMLAKMVRG
jgi:hypothetical protein